MESKIIQNIEKHIRSSIEEMIAEEYEVLKQEFIEKIEKEKVKTISAIALEISSSVSYMNNGREINVKIDLVNGGNK